MSFNSVFSNDWYTDTVDIYRVSPVLSGSITTQEWQQVAAGVKCRVYRSQINGLNMTDTAARTQSTDKLSCANGIDIRPGDQLMVTRGGALNSGNQAERYFAGSIQHFYDPLGGVVTGLSHQEVGLLLEQIAG